MLPTATILLSTLLLLSHVQGHDQDLKTRLIKRTVHQKAAARAATSTDRSAAALRKPKGTVPLGGFEYVGESGVSVQMMAMGTKTTAVFLDKAEGNEMQVSKDGVTHAAWAVSYDLLTNIATPQFVASNSFCAGGFHMGNGTLAVFGGNQPVTTNGTAVSDKTWNPTGTNVFGDTEGGNAIRVLDACDGGDETCPWSEGGPGLTMQSRRWYPTVEGLADGSVIVIGGDTNGGYVSTFVQNNPTYEYWPSRGPQENMKFLNDTVPVNLYPLTWLLPSGKLFMQAAQKTIIYDMDAKTETPLVDMPYSLRVYPASAATAMLPLTPDNNYKVTLLFCGGSAADISKSTDAGAGFNITAVEADATCVRISPEDASPTYVDDDSLPEGRSMGQFIYLPDGTMWMGNGVNMGTAGYGNEIWAVGESYGQHPLYLGAVYDPNAAAGSRFSRDGLTQSDQERMYHSSAMLLVDGSILVSGSNPNADVSTKQWGTNYAVERWYPLWYDEVRPEVSAWPTSLSYGGDAWSFTTTTTADYTKGKVVVIRPGFSTHAMNMGQRYLELATSYSHNKETGVTTVTVAQMPPNANLFQPGPAMIFYVVEGIPSLGEIVMVGSGAIGVQTMAAATVLPDNAIIVSEPSGSASSEDVGPAATAAVAGANSNASASPSPKSAASRSITLPAFGSALVALAIAALFA